MKRYLILFPIAAICLYDILFIRRNKFSNSREFKMINKPFEYSILGNLISSKINKQF